MGYVQCLRGMASGVEYAPDALMNLCPEDGRPVEIIMDCGRLQREQPDQGWYHPEEDSMWRFGGLLPLDISDSDDSAHVLSLGEGNTPLYEYSRYPDVGDVNYRLWIKDEGGLIPARQKNPTLSFKDRGLAMTVSMARRFGLDQLAMPTQGNAGDSLTEYGVAADMEVAVAMPESTPMPILGKVAAYSFLHEDVHLETVTGTIREASERIKSGYLRRGYFDVATFHEPGWRIEGKKTMGLELAEPQEASGAWSLPDVIVYPTGGGTGLVGMWKAFQELEQLGLIGAERPRMVAVQSRETAPLVEAFERRAEDSTAVNPGETLAVGLNVPAGIGHFRVLDILYKSDGAAVAITESRIADVLARVYREKGWWMCPEGAACMAALPQLADKDVIRDGDEVVVFNTASMEKYLPRLRDLLEGSSE